MYMNELTLTEENYKLAKDNIRMLEKAISTTETRIAELVDDIAAEQNNYKLYKQQLAFNTEILLRYERQQDMKLESKYREMLYDTLQLFRRELRDKFQDCKDADDWLFSNLNLTKEDALDIYRHRDFVYLGSCKEGE